MAKMLSQVATAIRGSVGGITYTANASAAIIQRARVSPVNPRTQNQNRMRSAFSTAVAAWSSLTQAQRDAWESYAQTLTYSGPLGNYTPTGRQVFLGSYSTAKYLEVRGLTITPGTGAPEDPGFLAIANLNITPGVVSGTGVTINCSNLTEEDLIVYAEISSAKDPARNYWTGPWNSASLDEVVLAAPSSGSIAFDNLTEGMKYFVKVRAISDTAPHRMSNLFILSELAETLGP
jgi:hypothetical protein